MTINKNQQNIAYKTIEERKSEAKKELGQASDIALQIYKSIENEPNENLLIRNFYYSIYHLIKAISILDTGLDYSTHSSLISYFNRENKKSSFLNQFNVNTTSIKDFGKDLNSLFVYRDLYDYRDRFVEEDDYKDAEKIWLHIFPELDNLVSEILNKI